MASSPGPEDRTHILSVNIQDGKAFGPDLQAVVCAATFAGETKLTPYSVGRDSHVWNTTLQWRVTMDQFRRLTSLGQKDCKVVLSNKDGTKLGWFLVDIRAAKLQAQYKKDEGVWKGLTGAKKGEAPQVYVQALFYEDRPGALSSPEPKQSPSKARGARRQQAVNRSSTAALPGASDAQTSDQNPASATNGEQQGQPQQLEDGGASGVAPNAGAAAPAQQPNPTAGLPSFGSPVRTPAGAAAADEGPFRHFALTVDVRSFQSSKRLPLSMASVYAQAILPPELIELVVASGFRLPSRLAPLTTHPAVDMARGTEGALPNGYGTLEFSAGVVQLARVLAREPRVSVEAWHKERFRTDMLLGAGSVPLSPLLQGAWVDGYAPLFALLASSVAGEVREERAQVGSLRVVLSLEDKGPAPPPGSGQPAPTSAALAAPVALATSATPITQQPSVSLYNDGSTEVAAGATSYAVSRGMGADAAAGPAAPAVASGDPAGLSRMREMHPAPPAGVSERGAPGRVPPPAYGIAPPPTLALPPPPALALAGGAPLRGSFPVGAGAGGGAALQGRQVAAPPEFEAAWELEVWKKAEEARWRSELREREAQRMQVVEAEWRRRERAREAELAGLKAEYLGLEEKAQQVLAAAEGRERRIVAAEEALLRRRKELEREHAGRMAEAEAAVRRLQVECEHQLDIEKDRNAELVRRVAMLEERLAASEARCLAVENEFADFRAASRSTPEAELARQLAEARETAKAAEARAAKAAKAKQGYKEQVRKLADQLAALQRRRPREEDSSSILGQSLGAGLGGLGQVPAPAAIRAAAQEQARYAASQQQELAAMRAQLQAIKAAAMAQLSPSSSPRGGRGSGGSDGGAGRGASVAAGRPAGQADGGADVGMDARGNDQQRHAAGRSDRSRGSGSEGRLPAAAVAITTSVQHHHVHHSAVSHGSVAPRPSATPQQQSLPPQQGVASSSGPSPAGSHATSTSSSASRQQPIPDNPSGGRRVGGDHEAMATTVSGGSGQWRGPVQQQQPQQRRQHSYEYTADTAVEENEGQEEGVRPRGAPYNEYQPAAPVREPSNPPAAAHPAGRARWDLGGEGYNQGRDSEPEREPQAWRALQPQQEDAFADTYAAATLLGGADAGEEQRRSLADHLANASSAAVVWYQHRDGLPQQQQPHQQHQSQQYQPQQQQQSSLESGELAGTWRQYQQHHNQHPHDAAGGMEEEAGEYHGDGGGGGGGGYEPAETSPPHHYQQQQQHHQQQYQDHHNHHYHQGPDHQQYETGEEDSYAGGNGREHRHPTEHTFGRSPPSDEPGSMLHGRDPALHAAGGGGGHMGVHAGAGAGTGDAGDAGDAAGDVDFLAEVQRLTRRKMELLRRGHDPGDRVVVLLDERIQALLAEGAGLPPPG